MRSSAESSVPGSIVAPLPAASQPEVTQPAAAPPAATRHVAVVGMSAGHPCGMRDHASLLAGALARHGVACSDHWLRREAGSLRGSRAEARRWLDSLSDELSELRPDAMLLHYSVFAYSYRGFPTLVPMTVAALRRTRLPLAGFMHELAFPWGLAGARGAAWAASHRIALADLARACRAIVVTTDFRERWLAERRWLPDRPLALAPVFSNLPPPDAAVGPRAEQPTIGMFGYSYDDEAIALVLDALHELRASHPHLQLALLGAPGAGSPLADAWIDAARQRGVRDSLRFDGPLPAQQLSDRLAGCDVLLFADEAGPSSRKGTLAGALAAGRPLVAVDGPRAWSELIRARAACVVEREPSALAGALGELLAEPRERDSLGRRGRAFAESQMGLGHSADVVSEMIDRVLAG